MGHYFLTTLINGAVKLAPIIAWIIAGWLIFFKLPFFFLRRSLVEQKKRLAEDQKGLSIVQEKYSVEDYQKFRQQMKGEQIKFNQSAPKKEKPKEEPKASEKASQKARTEEKKETPKKDPPKWSEARPPTAEEILGFKPGETFTQSELKKRYIELIRQNHPDKVASMGTDFKKLAEKNTKDINQAYDKLRKKSA